jgi:hypothetical protein
MHTQFTNSLHGTLVQRKRSLELPCPAAVHVDGSTVYVADLGSVEEAREAVRYINKILDEIYEIQGDDRFIALICSGFSGLAAAFKLPADLRDFSLRMCKQRMSEIAAGALVQGCTINGTDYSTISSSQYLTLTLPRNRGMISVRVADHDNPALHHSVNVHVTEPASVALAQIAVLIAQ